jgi:hypothetical protein
VYFSHLPICCFPFDLLPFFPICFFVLARQWIATNKMLQRLGFAFAKEACLLGIQSENLSMIYASASDSQISEDCTDVIPNNMKILP